MSISKRALIVKKEALSPDPSPVSHREREMSRRKAARDCSPAAFR
jgi:hypothetical protein